MIHRSHHSVIQNAPLIGVCAGLFLAALPLIPHVAPWTMALFAGALLVRLLVNHFYLGLPPLVLKVIVLVLGLTGITLSYGKLLGIEPGLGILLILISLKLLETNTVRDFQVLTLLGWFLSLCGLFFSQALGTWLYVAMVCALLTASVIRFHRGGVPGSFRKSARLGATLLVQATPIILLLFFFFPRSYGTFRFTLNRSFHNVSGMSDQLEPGSVAALAMGDEMVFRVEFPDGDPPPLPHLYWRGGVLWRGEGLSWRRLTPDGIESLAGRLDGPRVRQRIWLEPHGGKWLFALDRPAGDVPGGSLEAGGSLQSEKRINSPRLYEVVSRPENRETTLLPAHRSAALEVPAQVSARVRALVDSWRVAGLRERDIIDAALRFFRNGRFVYTLEPGTYGSAALDEFLFERRAGFCEHYAAAFATLMRLAGLPARLVIGYHGGEYNRTYLIVRQSEAHVWCEVWLKDVGWKRVDPTDVIAPGRINFGLESYLQSRAAANNGPGGEPSTMVLGIRDILRELRLTWDRLSYQWDLRVLSFDEENQRSFFTLIGLGNLDLPTLLTWNVTGSGIVLALLALWLGRPARRNRDVVTRQYDRFCKRLATAGLRRESTEGPLAFSQRAAQRFPEHAAAIDRISNLYIGLRYAKEGPAPGELSRAVRALRKVAPRREKPARL